MSPFTRELLAICRSFFVFERQQVCCGTVSLPQCVLLQHLLGGARGMTDLAAGLGASLSATTRLVDGLQRRGWLERTRDPADRRKVEVKLTAQGAEEALRLQALTETAVTAVLGRIPAGKHEQVLESLQLVRQAMLDARKGLGDCCP